MTSLVKALLAAGVGLGLSCMNVQAAEFRGGSLPIGFEPPRPVALARGSEIVIEGKVEDPGATVALRVDDGTSTDYGTRMNKEQKLPAGSFRIVIPVDMLRAEDGRVLDAGDIHRMIFFAIEGGERVTVARFEAATKEASSEAAKSTAPDADGPPAHRPIKFGRGRLPIGYGVERSARLTFEDEIRIEGTVHGDAPVGLVLRIDDAGSSSYSTRFNDERTFPPGPFHYERSLSGLKKPSGEILDPREVQRVVLDIYEGDGAVTVSRFEAARVSRLPEGVHGYSLGGADATLLAGFERVGPGDARLVGEDISIVRRPGPDPLVANGLKGVRRLNLPAPPGRTRVRLWIEDPGEWELLPHPLQRHIRVNGRDAVSIKSTFEKWIAERYLRGLKGEHTSQDDAWTAYGRFRGDTHAIDVDVGNRGIDIELQGSEPAALFLGAVLIEPAGESAGFEQVQAIRAAWYRSNFIVMKSTADEERPDIDLKLSGNAKIEPTRVAIAPGSGSRLRLSVTSASQITRPNVAVDPPEKGHVKLGVRMWAGERRLERPTLSGNTLVLDDNRLLADVSSLPLTPDAPRNYELWIDVPENAGPGVYTGAVSFGADNTSPYRVPIEVNVLPIHLPAAAKPAGFYLAAAPELSWFAPLVVKQGAQSACDLDFLHSFGLTGTAPPASVPRDGNFMAFLNDMRIAKEHGVAPGWLVYNPAHELLESMGPAASAGLLARVAQATEMTGIPPPIWSVADEPSNQDQNTSGRLREWVGELRSQAPKTRLAAHLNDPADEDYIPLFDTIIINEGFGLDADRIQQAMTGGRDVWIYNTGAPRPTAGLWLWATGARRYLQWHGRMPTADPFDPLDGREGDAQMIYPSLNICGAKPDIHRDLLRAAEGIVDQRWLLWLDQQSTTSARRLSAEIKSTLGRTWRDVKKLSDLKMRRIRDSIVALSQRSG